MAAANRAESLRARIQVDHIGVIVIDENDAVVVRLASTTLDRNRAAVGQIRDESLALELGQKRHFEPQLDRKSVV